MIKVLWLTNCVIPAVSKAMGKESKFVNEGWITQMFSQLTVVKDIRMTIVCDQSKISCHGESGNFIWYTIEQGIGETKKREEFRNILQNEMPDVIHVWGSEYSHTETLLLAADDLRLKNRVVISLQGIIYAIAKHYQSFLPVEAYNSVTLHDVLRKHSLRSQEAGFLERGESEKRAFKLTENVIGRTKWDKYCVKRINPNIRYHHCNETLREVFYTGEWKYEECRKYSIFVSQASYPIKGFHILLKAIPHLVKKYPSLHIDVAGADIVGDNTLTGRLKRSGYGKYLRKIIDENQLWDYISFLGSLNANEMKKCYLKANVFVSPSVIENSPNSVGEAMILGCPVVSSNVGGVASIIEDEKEGLLYPADDYYMLERCISEVFDNPSEASDRGKQARKHAQLTHDTEQNLKRILEIYKDIAQ